MNTHIVISIKDIEDEIENYNQLVKYGYNEQNASRSKHELNRILSMGKQISLNEEDIAYKAIEHSEELNEFNKTEALYQARISSYKQALKDLI